MMNSTSSLEQVLPTDKSMYEMLSIMFGDNMTVQATTPQEFAGTYVGLYVDGEGAIGGACFCDMPFAAYSGGVMTMMPVDVAKEMIESNELTELLHSNLHEVLNICTRLIIDDHTRHLKLNGVHAYQDVASSLTALVQANNRVDFEVDIPRYGSGKITFMVS